MRANFVVAPNKLIENFGELQAHRNCFGLMGVVCAPDGDNDDDDEGGDGGGEAKVHGALTAARDAYEEIKVRLNT